MTNYEIKDIYDIATAFITDKNTIVKAETSEKEIKYTFTRQGLAKHPYTLTISAIRKAPIWQQEASAHPMSDGRVYTETRRFKKKNYGTINLSTQETYNICCEPVTIGKSLLNYETKHEVGSALDKTQCDLKRFITRLRSPNFFNTLELAEKRIAGKIETSDNSKQIFDMIFRLKAKQK